MKNTETLQDIAKRLIDLGEKASKEYVNRHKEKTFSTTVNDTVSAVCEIKSIIKSLSEEKLLPLKALLKEEMTKCEQDSARYYGCMRVIGSIETTLNPVQTIWS